jgi:hypothetical protein
VTAFYILKFMSQNRSDPNYSAGFTPNYLASHVQGIKSQTWKAMHEILENFEKKRYVEKLYDGITKQTRYKITDEGVAAYLRWEPVMNEWVDFEF